MQNNNGMNQGKMLQKIKKRKQLREKNQRNQKPIKGKKLKWPRLSQEKRLHP